MADFDVFIAGAGPGGSATAISLGQFAPELSVGLADAPRREALRIGEAVPPPIKPILDHLGVWPTFEADGHSPSYRTLSAWGSDDLGSNEFLLNAHQVGWRLDRGRFDAMMVRAAQRTARPIPARVNALSYADGIWRIACSDGTTHTARAVVDATGRSAALARLHGLRRTNADKLVGCFAHFEGGDDRCDDLMIETFRDGWWYMAAIPGGRRVIACMSDADVVRQLRLGQSEGWMRALADTRHVGATVKASRPLGPPRVCPAGSQTLTGDAPPSLLRVGDAASCFDPISAQGIVKALRSGIFASYAIADWLRLGDAAGIKRYRALVDRAFAAYRETLRDYYALEERWPGSPFWQRRRHDDARRREQTTSPTAFAANASAASA